MNHTTDAPYQCQAGILYGDRCKNDATLETRTGYKCCEHHAPRRDSETLRDDVKAITLSEKTTLVSDKMTAKLNTAFNKGLDQIYIKGSDTPRTDAWTTHNGVPGIEYVYASIARSLEKELNALKAELKEKTHERD